MRYSSKRCALLVQTTVVLVVMKSLVCLFLYSIGLTSSLFVPIGFLSLSFVCGSNNFNITVHCKRVSPVFVLHGIYTL